VNKPKDLRSFLMENRKEYSEHKVKKLKVEHVIEEKIYSPRLESSKERDGHPKVSITPR